MHDSNELDFDARPAWRYQWAALLGALAAGALAIALIGWSALYGASRAVHVAVAACAALCAYLLLLVLYRRYAWRFAIDGESIESRHGLVARQVRAIRVKDLRNINVRQSIMQRLLRVGDVEFSSAAGSEVEVIFFGVSDPLAVKRLAQARQHG